MFLIFIARLGIFLTSHYDFPPFVSEQLEERSDAPTHDRIKLHFSYSRRLSSFPAMHIIHVPFGIEEELIAQDF
jgi:hypothetical protein